MEEDAIGDFKATRSFNLEYTGDACEARRKRQQSQQKIELEYEATICRGEITPLESIGRLNLIYDQRNAN